MAKRSDTPAGPFVLTALLCKAVDEQHDGRRVISGIFNTVDPTGGAVMLLLTFAAPQSGTYVLTLEGVDAKRRRFALTSGANDMAPVKRPLRLEARSYTDIECNLHLGALPVGTSWIIVRLDNKVMTAVPFRVGPPERDVEQPVH